MALSAFGQDAPLHARLPNFDKRQKTEPSPERRAAAERLKTRGAGVAVQFDEVTGSPKHVVSRFGRLDNLAKPQGIGPAEAHSEVKAFVRAHGDLFGHGAEALERARVRRQSTNRRSGARTVVWEQQLDGIPVFEGVFIAHTARDGEVASISSQLVPDLDDAAQRGMPNWAAKKDKLPISREMAQAIAGRNVGGDADGARTKLVWLATSPDAMRLAWEVPAKARAGGDVYRLLVDSETGEVLVRHARTFYLSDATYHVFTGASPAPMSPALPTPSTNQAPTVPRTMVTIAALSTNASPIGWINDADSETRGNNVDAHLDRNADDQADLPRPQGGSGRVFDYPLELTQSPLTYGDAAAVNLFYWCNWMHDRLYELGFDEAAGNFQKDNFGRGGEGNDAIIANAQDGSGVNNARFFPGPDGTSGRIEMFVFDGPEPDRDGDFDAEIILHEYAHGLTDRMVGGGAGIYQLVTFGLGEGWSDFYALAMLNDGSQLDGNYTEGGYSTYQLFGLTQNYYYGIRRYPYTTDMSKNPLTFKDIDRNQISSYPNVPRNPIHPFNPAAADQVHRMGEVWCVTLWEVRANLIRKHGFPAGNELVLQLVTDGLKLSPPNPTFLQARDAILLADRLLTSGANQTEIWAGFAKRGMGLAATDGPNWTTEGIRQSFDTPDALTVIPAGVLRFSGPLGGPIGPSCRTLLITNPTAATLSWHASSPEPYFTLTTGSGTLAPGQSAWLDVCVAPGSLGLAIGTYTAPLYVTNLNSGVVQRRDLTIQTLSLARLPFSEDFESETLGPYWTLSGTGLARTLLSTNEGPYSGMQHLLFSTAAGGWYGRNEATLALDLAGYTNVVVRFWAREFKDRPDGPPAAPFFDSADFDGVAISLDGRSWYEAAGLRRLREDYSEVTVQLDETLARHGLAYTSSFRIRFNQAGAMPIPDGGIAIDNLSIAGLAPRRFSLSLPGSVQEGAGTLSGQASARLPVAPAVDVTVQLSSSNPQVVSVPETVILRAGETSAAFDLQIQDDDLLDGEQTVVISAAAAGHFTGEATLRVADDETAILSLTVQGNLIEGHGLYSGAGRVTLDRAPTRNLAVQLESSDPAVVSVPAGAVIPSGQTSAPFNLFAGDDNALDGPQTVTLSARLTEDVLDALDLAVQDNETTNLFVTVPPLLNESSATLASVGNVRLSGTVPTNVIVFLASSHTNRLRVPASVTIRAGQLSAPFNLTLVEDSIAESPQAVRVTAAASQFGDGQDIVRLLDNDTAPLAYNPRPRPSATTSARGVQLAWDLGLPDLVVNGDFETGNFSGWVKETTGGGDFVVNTGISDPPGPEGRTPPYAGRFSALSQQNSPGQRTIYQDIAIPIFFDSAVLNWTHRIRNHASEFSGEHFFRVEIRALDNSPLGVAFSTEPGDALLNDWQEHSFSLQNYRGSTIRIAFVESDSLGFLNVGLDNVRVFLGSPGTVTSEIYLGSDTNLNVTHFQGATTNTVWDLPALALDSPYYWQIVTRRGEARTANSIWQFSTRGIGPLDHFAWSAVASNQLMGHPFPASILAKDMDGNTISNFARSVSLTAEMPESAEPVQVLTFTGFRLSSREYRRTLAAISIHFTNYVETFFTATDPAVLETQLASKDVFLVVEQDGAPVERMAPLGEEWGPVLRSFVANGGVLIVCSHTRDEHELLNRSDLMRLTKVSPYGTAELRVTAAHPLTEGLSSTFPGANLSGYTSENGLSVVALADGGASVVLARAHGAGTVVMIGTDFLVNRTGMDRVVANAVKLAQGPTSSQASVAPPFTGYFQNGRWSGNVAVLAAGSNIVVTADDGQGHVGRSIPLTVAGQNDLSVTLVDTPDPVTLGSNIVYTAQVRNSGPAGASGVQLNFEVPANLDIVSFASSQGACALNQGTIDCNLGALAANASAQVVVEASPRTDGTVRITATVVAASEDPYPVNNSDTASTIVGLPSIFIFSRSATEGHTGSNTIVFPLQLRPASRYPVSVQYASSNLTAMAGTDYVAQSGTVIFAPGQTNQTISFSVLGDRLYEGTELFAVFLHHATNGILGESLVGGTIVEDDPLPALSILDTTLLEGTEGITTQASFTVQLSTNAGTAVTAKYASLAGSATRVFDFLEQSGMVTIPAGRTMTNILVTINGDRISETNETFFVRLSDVANATLARSQATGTILDDDIGELDHFAWDTIPTEQQYGVPFPVTITAKNALGQIVSSFDDPVSLTGWAAARQTSVGPGDAPREFPMGAYFHDQRVQVIYHSSEVGEASRITGLALLVQTPPGQTLNRWTIRMKHSDLDRFDQPKWEQGWTTVFQDNETLFEGGWVEFPFSQPFHYNGVQSLLVDFSFNNSTYTVNGQCDSLPTSDLRAQFFQTDSAYGDPLGWVGSEPPAELGRWVPSVQFLAEQQVEISPGASGVFVNGAWTGHVTVLDIVEDMSLRADDSRNHAGSANAFSVVTTNDLALAASDLPDPARAGDTLVFTYHVTNSGPDIASGIVLLNPLPAGAKEISIQSSQGSCGSLDGIVECSLGSLAAGGTATVSVHAIPEEGGFLTNTVFVLSDNSELFLGNNQASTVTRVNPRGLLVADVTVTETTDAFTNALFNVRLSSASSSEITVAYSTMDLTATNGFDYLEAKGVLIFPPGVTNISVAVPVIGDLNDEPNESFRLTLSNPTNAIVLTPNATATIVDDDPPPVVTPGDATIVEGNSGASFFMFPVHISPASGLFATMTYTTSNGTATAGSDYFPQSLTVLLPPNFTNRVISTTIFGDRLVEEDEHFFLHFSRPQNMFLATNIARGTIVNDDGLPGVIETFAWSDVPSPQRVGRAVPVAVEARDSYGNRATNFAGAALIRGRAGSTDVLVGGNNSQSFNPMATSVHDNRMSVIYLTNELAGPRRIRGLALEVLVPPGQPLTRWTIRMKHTSLSNYLTTIAWDNAGWTTVYQNDEIVDRTGWAPFIFQTPFDYNGSNNLMVDFSFDNSYFTVDGFCRFTATNQARTLYGLSDSEGGAPTQWSTIPASVLSGMLPAQFISGSSIAVTPEVATFSNGLWTGAITMLEPSSSMSLVADDTAGHIGFSAPFMAEFVADADSDGLLDEWELAHFGSLAASPGDDPDGDGLTNLQEQTTGTHPLDHSSVLRVLKVTFDGSDVVVHFNSIIGRTYRVERSDQLASGQWTPVADNLPGIGEVLQVSDFGAAAGSPRFYRVRLLP